MKEKIRLKLLCLLKELRVSRNSNFLFTSKKISMKNLLLFLLFELGGRFAESDQRIISEVLKDLVKIKILHPNCLRYYEYSLGGITYYDVYLKTIENKYFCRGTSTDKSQAFAKALGEVFERTTLKYPTKEDNFIVKNLNEIKEDPTFVDFNLFGQATDEQREKFVQSDIKDSDTFKFIKTKRVTDNKEIYLPMQTVFYGNSNTNFEKVITQSTTNGAGAGFTKEGAYFSGLLEIIHRHFFLKSWYFKNSPSRIKIESLQNIKELYEKIKNFENRDFTVFFLDYSEESKIPTSICIIERFGGWYCGGASSDKLAQALERSLDEALSTYLWCIQTTIEGNNNVDENFVSDIENNFIDKKMDAVARVLIFGDNFYTDKLDKFILGGKEVDYTNSYDLKNKEKINEVVPNIFGKDIFVYEKENSYLKDYDYFVARVVVPNSYYFALDEIHSRPVLNNIQPINTAPNPFP